MRIFARLLDREGPVILDGGLATRLEAMGHDIGDELWSAALLASDPQSIIDAHLAYLEAGAEIITSASYQASRDGFMARGFSAADADRLIVSGVELAKAARDKYLAADSSRGPVLVAASIGPFGAAMHDGSEYTGSYDASDDRLRRFHAERLALLDAAGADVLAVETIPQLREAEILHELLAGCSTPAWVAFCCRDGHKLSDGTPARDAAAIYADHPTVLALGVNCTPPQLISSLIGELRSAAPRKAIVVYPNSGETYHSSDNSWSGAACDLDRDFDVAAWSAAGAKLIGGCCRTGPEDIARIRARLRQAPVPG
jgi:homocysteine S-methyltransferase